jgi:hypothetical protein
MQRPATAGGAQFNLEANIQLEHQALNGLSSPGLQTYGQQNNFI